MVRFYNADINDLLCLAEKFGYECIADEVAEKILSLVEACKKHEPLPTAVQELLTTLEEVL